ncbi:MAG: GNAT family N-acetyltransferase [Alphaproteobacteria bacterium]|nr:GNAT family N-acetyltransferase [Alphaproteobacteria bacterium]
MIQSHIGLRFAKTKADLDKVYPLVVELHESSGFRSIPLSREKCNRFAGRAFTNPEQHALVIAEIDGDPIGFIFCSVSEFMVGTDALITSVMAFYVGERHRSTMIGGKVAIRLLSTVIEWSKKRGSREIMIHVTSGIDIQRTDKFLRRANFKVIGANYAFSLNTG